MASSTVEAGIGPAGVVRDDTLFDVDQMNLAYWLRFNIDDVIEIYAKQFHNSCDVATIAYLQPKTALNEKRNQKLKKKRKG